MSMEFADSVAIFSEGTFEDQVLELVTYLSRAHPEDDRAAFIQTFQESTSVRTADSDAPSDEDTNASAERKRGIISHLVGEVKSLGDGVDREVEGFFNLLFSHVFNLYPLDSPDLAQIVTALSKTIGSSSSPNDSTRSALKYRILTNLFNIIPRRSSLRLIVCEELIQLATQNDELDVLQLSVPDTDRWTHEWGLSQEQKSAFLKTIADAYTKVGQLDTAYLFTLSHARSIPPTSPLAKPTILSTISFALKLPSLFEFDALFTLEGISLVHGEPIYALLEIVATKGIKEYKAWEAANGDSATVLEGYGLVASELEHKIRLLTLASMAFSYIGRDVPYAEIASTIQVEPSQVEKWIIDAIRSSLIWGKLSQTTQTVHINKSKSRAFGDVEQWKVLEKRLATWKAGLMGVLDVVVAAQQTGSGAGTAGVGVNGVGVNGVGVVAVNGAGVGVGRAPIPVV